ncbi:GntR family transcriptional regulator [Pseudonocardia xishanensis]|uniref:HTH gntR-type domain-containing protein n=1 Tax=Pseudonocardia xishanensis TaxID=630995 RepID=A0ABP8S0W0_9PSEU
MSPERNILGPEVGGSRHQSASGQPAYKALYEQLRSSILSGQLAAGTRLPPSRILAADTGMSRNTVLAAFEQLQAEGYVTGRQGSGTYVAQVLPERLLGDPATSVRPSPSSSATARVPGRLSARGDRLARTRRVPLPSVLDRRPRGTSFLIGLPALDAFPFETWAKLYRERFRRSAPS